MKGGEKDVVILLTSELVPGWLMAGSGQLVSGRLRAGSGLLPRVPGWLWAAPGWFRAGLWLVPGS